MCVVVVVVVVSEVNGQLDAEIQKRRMDFLQKGR